MYFSNASANAALSERSANAISGSIIQNSARWRRVFEFSARKVGPKVSTSVSARQYASIELPREPCAEATHGLFLHVRVRTSHAHHIERTGHHTGRHPRAGRS